MLPRYIGVGLCTTNSNLNKLPGWEKHSYGYHADDGCIFNASGSGDNYGPTFTTGDVVGCGYNMVDKAIFFTKNGVNLGTAFTGIPVSDIVWHIPLEVGSILRTRPWLMDWIEILQTNVTFSISYH